MAIKHPYTRAGFGGVIRDDKGNWVIGYACNIEATTVAHIETVDLLRGLQLALVITLYH